MLYSGSKCVFLAKRLLVCIIVPLKAPPFWTFFISFTVNNLPISLEQHLLLSYISYQWL